MKNLSITYLAGEYYCKNPMVMVTLNTMRDHFKGDRVILTHEINKTERNLFGQMGYEIVDCESPINSPYVIYWHRWKALYEYLCSNVKNDRKYDNIIFSDSRDILWQRDPFENLPLLSNTYLFSEGMTHRNSNWNYSEQKSLMATVRVKEYDFDDWEVINGGVVLGNELGVRNLDFQMFMMTAVGHGPMTDQCFLNFLYHNIKDPCNPLKLLNLDQNGAWVATGNTMKERPMPFVWEDGILYNDAMVKLARNSFALFHQWDRTEFRGEILTNHGVPRIE